MSEIIHPEKNPQHLGLALMVCRSVLACQVGQPVGWLKTMTYIYIIIYIYIYIYHRNIILIT